MNWDLNFITGAFILIAYDIIKIIIMSKLTAKEVRKEKERWKVKNGDNNHKE